MLGSQEFILKNTDEKKSYLIQEINQIEFKCKKHKLVSTTQNNIEHFLISGSTITRCISISTFSSLVGIPIRITTSAI